MKRVLQKPIIVEHSRVPGWLSFVIQIKAITLWPFIFVRGSLPYETRTHETIHFKQYNELWVIGFLVLYAWDYAKAWWKYKGDSKKAYYQIRLEQEAYDHQDDPCYPDHRNKFAWKKYTV